MRRHTGGTMIKKKKNHKDHEDFGKEDRKKPGKLRRFAAAAEESDFPLRLFTTILVIIGIIMIFSASYYYSISREGTPYAYLIKQGVYAVMGFILMNIASNVDYHILRKYSVAIMAVSLALLLLLFTPVASTVYGATRWIRFGPVSIMPGEISKLAMIIFASAFFAQDSKKAESLKEMLPLLVLVGIVAILIKKQPNLSTAITVVVIVAGIAFLAGLKKSYIVLAVAAGAVLFAAVASFGPSYQKDRIFSFLDPFESVKGEGYQVVQSLLALGSGGLKGLGIGKGVQKTLYLPEPHTDFILSIVGEETGFIGIAVLMILFMLLVWRCFVISLKAPDRFGMYLSGGLGIMVGVQVLLNVAVVTSSMPPTGVALPFISYGGNSLWIFMFMVGVVLNISKQSGKNICRGYTDQD